MKKTLNINIGNSIIHIEEDAFELLTGYLNEVKHHFSKTSDDFEIVTDIENRIAEMFQEILAQQQKQAINIEDVKAIITRMGSVKDFESSEETEHDNSTPNQGPQFDSVKKLYRDTDQAMVAGVCIGLAHYMDIDARWIRLAALLSCLMGGSGILAYIVLWIFIPKAVTKSEKMAMRGEEPNLRGFMNSHLNPLMKHSRGFIAEVFQFIGTFINGTGRVVFKTIAIGMIVFCAFILLALVVTMAGLFGFWDANAYNYFPISIINEDYLSAIIISTFIVFAVPTLALILFAVRVAFNSRPVNKTLSFGLLIVWLAAVMVGIFYIAKISTDFRESAEFSQVSEITVHGGYLLSLDKTRFFTKEDSLRYQIDSGNYKGRKILSDDYHSMDQPRNVRLRIEKSDSNRSTLTENYSAKGKTFEAALKQAQNIHYDFLQKDSVLNFSQRLQLIKKSNWRDQEVQLILRVPVGTRLYIPREFEWYISGFDYWNCEENSGLVAYIMTDNGIKCAHEKVYREEN